MRYVTTVLLAMNLTLVAACGDPGPDPTDPGTTSGSQPPPVAADLAVTSGRVYPANPIAGASFRIEVSVGNVGTAPSSQYDVAAVVWYVSGDKTYPAGAATEASMQPGEDWGVIGSDMNVFDPGSYQLKVEISPWEADANSQNNTYIWAFTVN